MPARPGQTDRPPLSPHSPAAPSRSIVVVGAGLAGAQTVAALRAHGFDGRVTLLGAEGAAPYDRPPLSKELLSRPGPAWVADELGVDVGALAEADLADPAVALDVVGGRAVVTTGSGRRVEADAAVLAVGSHAVRPAAWDAALTLHTLDDAAALRERVVPGARLAVVGAGWIGAEVAGVAAGAGVDVTVVEAGPAPLARQLGERVGALLTPWFAEAGVALRTGVPVVAVHDGGVDLADGTLVEAGTVLVAVGARPSTGWLAGTIDLDERGTVRTDADGRALAAPAPDGTAAPAVPVWAVGDCATREHPRLGPVPGGHWSAALHDPDATVRAMLGLDRVPPHTPYVFSRQLGHDLALFGQPRADDVVHLRGDPTGRGWAALYVDPTTLPGAPGASVDNEGRAVVRVGAVLLADLPREVGAVRRLMNRDEPLDVVLDLATDPTVPWKSALPG